MDAMLMNEELSRVEARGIAKGTLENSFNNARGMFRLGISKEQIRNITGLSASLLEKARRDETLTEEEIAATLA